MNETFELKLFLEIRIFLSPRCAVKKHKRSFLFKQILKNRLVELILI